MRNATGARLPPPITAATTTRAQAQQQAVTGRSVPKQTRFADFAVVINKKPSSTVTEPPTEQQWNSLSEEEFSDNEEPMDWEEVSTPSQEDMERTIRRSPQPQEDEWTPTLDGTLRIRSKARPCSDEVEKPLHYHQPPPPPPSSQKPNSPNSSFCWTCKSHGHTSSSCPKNLLQYAEDIILNNCQICHKPGHTSDNCPNYITIQDSLRKCTKCGKEGHYSVMCKSKTPQTTKGKEPENTTENPPKPATEFPTCIYCLGRHKSTGSQGARGCRKRRVDNLKQN